MPALRGALTTIRHWRPMLVLETLPESDWMTQNILSLGYEVVGVVQHNSVLVCRAS